MELSEESLRDDLKRAMLSRDSLRTGVLRGVLSAIKYKTLEAKDVELSATDLVAIIKREAKQCGETLEFARKAERGETVAECEAVLAVLESYLPQQLTEDELAEVIETIVGETGASSIGPVMKELGARHAGRFDGKLASRIVAQLLAR